MDSDLDVFSSLRIHPGWIKVQQYVAQQEAERLNSKAIVAVGKDKAYERALTINGMQAVLIFVESEYKKAKQKNEQAEKPD